MCFSGRKEEMNLPIPPFYPHPYPHPHFNGIGNTNKKKRNYDNVTIDEKDGGIVIIIITIITLIILA